MFNASSHKQQSVMQHRFSSVPKAEIQRSSFDRSHGYKTTFDAGLLVPIFLDEALPGDTFKLNMTGFARLATPIFPIMDNMMMDTHFFAVPMRLVWDNWQKFNGEQRDPGDSTDFTIPQMVSTASTGYLSNSLFDYLGLPVGIPGFTHSALFLRAYNLVWNEWFRDQNLQDSVAVPRGDGPDTPADYTLLRRGKRHDYFTSSLPWPQKGAAVSIPLGGSAPVVSAGSGVPQFFVSGNWLMNGATPLNTEWGNATLQAAGTPATWSVTALEADLTAATATTINSMRQAFQVQRLFEKDARGGTRYTEILRQHFGVTSPDARLQRPEYLGGGSSPINISPIPQTGGTGTGADTPQGNLAAMGTALLNRHGFTMSFTEHCIVIGVVSVRADLTYQAGLERMWSRTTRQEFYWPSLSHIGEQAVLRQEIFLAGNAGDDDVFGYQERYAEYRYKPSKITGLFRSNVTAGATSLDAWHLSQDFPSAPSLDENFIREDPPVDRVIAVPSEPHFLFDAYFKMHCARPMPVFGVPGLIDHF